jgi:FtsP/CotA-like multicopper oxidase with cupredoxin domain
VVGVEVQPAGHAPRVIASASERRMRLLVRPNRGSNDAKPLFGYAIHESGAEPPRDSGMTAGPPIDLVRGQPVRIMVVNRLSEPTAVHWHGIELESYYDGVPGFSGAGRRLTPLIPPADSFEVRFTPPRSGTFIYHTHADEERQQRAGLAGILIVSDSGKRRDAAIDIPILISAPHDFDEAMRSALINGSAKPQPIEMRAGSTYRFRIVQMSAMRAAVRVEIKQDSTFVRWRPVAKDGADSPPAMRVMQPARVFMGIGEILDVEINPEAPGEMRLEIRLGQPWPAPSVLMTTMPIIVRP